MFNIFQHLNTPIGFYDYIWIDVILIKETPKVILIEFDGRRMWFPKGWIVRMGRNKSSNDIKIKISQYYWSKKVV